MSEDRRALVLSYNGLAVRLAARRPNGKVLVQYLMPKSHVPMPSWAEAHPFHLRAAGMTMPHLKSLIVVLPLARFAGEDDKPTIDATPATTEAVPEVQARLPYKD